MAAFLAAEDAFDIVIQHEPRPPATRLDAIRNYEKRTSRACAMLLSACHSSIITYVAEEEDPAEMWTILARICDTTASIAGRTAIYRSFYELKPIAGEPITSYCSKLQNYRRLLNNTEQAITDEAFLVHFSSTIPSSFRPVVRNLQHQAGQYTVERVVTEVIEEDRQMRNDASGDSANTVLTTATGLQASSLNRGRGGYRGGNQGRGFRGSRGSRGF